METQLNLHFTPTPSSNVKHKVITGMPSARHSHTTMATDSMSCSIRFPSTEGSYFGRQRKSFAPKRCSNKLRLYPSGWMNQNTSVEPTTRIRSGHLLAPFGWAKDTLAVMV